MRPTNPRALMLDGSKYVFFTESIKAKVYKEGVNFAANLPADHVPPVVEVYQSYEEDNRGWYSPKVKDEYIPNTLIEGTHYTVYPNLDPNWPPVADI